MRLIDKDALLESLKDLEASGGSKMYRKALDDALHYFFPKIIEDQQIFDFPPNAPLTLEELREMDGESVWLRNLCTGDYMCRVIARSGEHFTHFTDGGLHENRSYGSHWLAYRRKPEEGTWQQ